MTWTAVGSTFFVANSSTFSLTPGNIGDLILVQVVNEDSSTSTANALSSSNVTWATMGTPISNSGNNVTSQVFAGTATGTGTATVTVSWSGATPTDIRIAGNEFTSSVGSWALDTEGNVNGTATNTWASLTPAGSGELYWGFCLDQVQAVAGSTSGYVYAVDPVHGNGAAYNLSVSSASAPVWGDSTQIFGIMLLVKETATAPSGTVQPRATIPVPRRRPARAVTGFVPVVTVNTGHGPAGTVQPLAASLVAPRRKPGRAVVHFIPVTTTNAPAKPHPAHGTPSSDEARGWKRWLLWGS